MPFDQFATWQLAGDLLPSHTKEQSWPRRSCASASGRLRTARSTRSTASSTRSIAPTTIGTGFLGHDGRLRALPRPQVRPDPTKDFYSLTGFFNSTDEPGFYAPGARASRPGRRCPGPTRRRRRRSPTRDAAVAQAEAAFDAARRRRAHERCRTADALLANPASCGTRCEQSIDARSAWRTTRSRRPRRFPTTLLPTPRPQARAVAAAARAGVARRPCAATGHAVGRRAGQDRCEPRQRRPRWRRRACDATGSLLRDDLGSPSTTAARPRRCCMTPILRDGVNGKAFYFDDNNRGVLGQDVGYFERTQPFSVDLWVMAGGGLRRGAGRSTTAKRQRGQRRIQLQLDRRTACGSTSMHSPRRQRHRDVTRSSRCRSKSGRTSRVTYDGSSRAQGVALYVNGDAG